MSIDVLLVIRYLGEEEDCESSRESRSSALLAKLQEQVKAREQQSVSNTAEEDNDHLQSDKEQKKRKRQETDGVQLKTKKTDNVKKSDLNDEAASSTKKKKKHKTVTNENESMNTGNADLLLCLIVFKLVDLVDVVFLKHFGTF